MKECVIESRITDASRALCHVYEVLCWRVVSLWCLINHQAGSVRHILNDLFGSFNRVTDPVDLFQFGVVDTFALFHVENVTVAKHWDLLLLRGSLSWLCVFIIVLEEFPKNDEFRFFAFSNVATKVLRLLVGQPKLGMEF